MRSLIRSIACLSAIVVLGFLASCSRQPAVTLKGTVMTMTHPAPDFTLTDQHGASYRLSADRGKVVVLAFIYTHCTDICPFVALKAKEAISLLGADAGRADFVAVTTDPARDTVPVVAKYSQAIDLMDTWHFVTGTTDDLKKVWGDYGIGVTVQSDSDTEASSASASAPANDQSPSQGLSGDDLATAGRIVDAFGGGYEVSHTAPYWIVDPKGNLRVVMDADVLPADIAGNVRALLPRR